MEKIKVNMSPNPLDVQTIHASQNDGEARQWEFELHNNGELIDTSDVKEQLVFKAYKGGTEQLLPENTSTPTTSPFKGDIRYPQGLLADQEFTYRQSPTESDGLAKITDIKGNTLVWNQLVHGEFGSNYTDYWSVYRGTGSVSNGELTVTDAVGRGGIRLNTSATLPLVVNHKYFISLQYKSTVNLETHFVVQGIKLPLSSSYNTYSSIVTHTGAEVTKRIDMFPEIVGETGTFSIKNVMCFDLTQMCLDISNPSDFTSLFSLPYYAYNQGSLLSFNGNGIKTVGKNQFDKNTAQSNKTINASGQVVSGSHNVSTYIPILPNTNYYLSNVVPARDGRSGFTYDGSLNPISVITISGQASSTSGFFTAPSNARYMVLSTDAPDICQLEFGTSATSYEPYTSFTLSLPISTYFPNGMNGFDGYYDELTENKATKGIDALDLGTKNYIIGNRNTDNTGYTFYFQDRTVFQSAVPIRCAKFTQNNSVLNWESLKVNECLTSSSGYFVLCADYNDVASLKNALQGVYLYYPLVTSIETSFTTASLVTENTEIPLSNEDGTLIGKCTEELSAEPGFHDAKIKLADADGECYSNKIQLHVERKPS